MPVLHEAQNCCFEDPKATIATVSQLCSDGKIAPLDLGQVVTTPELDFCLQYSLFEPN